MDGSANVTLTVSLGANVVANTDLAVMGANTIKGAVTAGDPVDLTPAQARSILNVEDGANKILPGTIFAWPLDTVPAGYVAGDGQVVTRSAPYNNLFSAVSGVLVTEAVWSAGNQGKYAVGDGATTFRLPDYRGMVLRGKDGSRGVDMAPTREIGSYQADANKAHTHTATATSAGAHTHTAASAGAHTHTLS